MATARAAPQEGAGDDEDLVFDQALGEEGNESLQHQGEDGGGSHEDEGATKDGEGATKKVHEARLAEGGEADLDEEGEGSQGQGKDEHHRHDGKKTRKQRQDQYRRAARRLREERDFALEQNFEILQRLAAVEGTALETRLLTIDGRIAEYQNDADQALSLETQALTQGDQEALRQARLIREQALSRKTVLESEKGRVQAAINARASQPQRPQQRPLPGQAEINQLATQFKANKPWLQFRQDGSPANRETAVYHAIDLAMQAEARFTPNEPEYWQELDRRGRSALPHLFGEDDVDLGDGDEVETVQQTQHKQAPPQRQAPQAQRTARGPAVAGSGRQANASGSAHHDLLPAQVAHLKEEGLWGNNLNAADKKERDELIKYFRQHNRANGAN
jgi:hypothetical protein